MATKVTIKVPPTSGNRAPLRQLNDAVANAMEVFHRVDRTCTRFDPESPLMVANRTPRNWHRVPTTLFLAIDEAKRAHDVTRGRFDPRVLRSLVALGYDRTLAFDKGGVSIIGAPHMTTAGHQGPWQPGLRHSTGEVLIGGEPIDLGGIGKGLAVRWASESLGEVARDFLIEAGGDCYCSGSSEDGENWRVGVEDPASPQDTLCVLSLSDRAVTTSSIRLRRWLRDGSRVHHLIDPKTGVPGGRGLVSVTVVGPDPARAEVWSKALFVSGHTAIAGLANRRGIAALWIDERGELATSSTMERYIQWRRS